MLLLLACADVDGRQLPDGDTADSPVDSADTPRDSGDEDDTSGGDSGGDSGDDTGTVDGLPVERLAIGSWCGPPGPRSSPRRASPGSPRPGSRRWRWRATARPARPRTTSRCWRWPRQQGSTPPSPTAGASPALRAYHVQDEPPAAVFGALVTVVDAMAAVDPAHFVSVNLFPDYASTAPLGTHG